MVVADRVIDRDSDKVGDSDSERESERVIVSDSVMD